jgi:hypothetical protein
MMIGNTMMTRREFLQTCVAAAAAVWLGPKLTAAEEVVRLKSWEWVEIPSLSKKLNQKAVPLLTQPREP